MDNIKTILMISTKPISNDPRVFNEAQSLIKAGFRVICLRWDKEGLENTANVLDNGLIVYRVYNNSKSVSEFLRLIDWWKVAVNTALWLDITYRFDAIHCHDFSTLPLGIKLKKLLHKPLVYDAHEIWSKMVVRNFPKGTRKIITKILAEKERQYLKDVDEILTVTPPLKTYFEKLTSKKIHLLMNCKHIGDLVYKKPEFKKFTILYLGLLAKHRFILELIDVVKDNPDVQLILGGKDRPIVKEIKKKIKDVDNIYFIGEIPMKNVINLTKKSHVIMTMIDRQDKNDFNAFTNKQFEAMVCARPVITTIGTWSGHLSDKCTCGLPIMYNKKALDLAIRELKSDELLCKHFGINGLYSAYKKYNWDNQVEILIKIYKRLLK